MITQDELKDVLHYCKESGRFTWINPNGTKIKPGEKAGSIHGHGYRVIAINGKIYYAHRLAFLFVTGAFPIDYVDHLNHKRSDNRWINLRAVTRGENQKNKKLNKNNKSGFAGVSWKAADKRWVANINTNGKRIHLGLFTSLDDAIAARMKANIEHKFHENHGL